LTRRIDEEDVAMMRKALAAVALCLAVPSTAQAFVPSCPLYGWGTYVGQERTRCGIATYVYTCGGAFGAEVTWGPALVAWTPLPCQNY